LFIHIGLSYYLF